MMCCYREERARKHERDEKGNQRFKSRNCGRAFLKERPTSLEDMRINHDKAQIFVFFRCPAAKIPYPETRCGRARVGAKGISIKCL